MKAIRTLIILYIALTTVICAFADGGGTQPFVESADTIVDTIKMAKDTLVVETDKQPAQEGETNLVLILGLILSAYEVFARFVPTVKDISVLSWIMKFISTVMPNMKSGGGTHNH